MAEGTVAGMRLLLRRGMWPLRRLDAGLAWAELLAGCLILAALVGVLAVQVASRQLPGVYVPWTEEVSRFLFVWLAFLGTALAFQRNAHVAITLLAERAGPRLALALGLFVRALVVGFALIMLVYGLRLCLSTRMVSTVLRLPMWLPYAAIPVAGALMTVHGGVGMLGLLAGERPGGERQGGEARR